MKRTYEEYRKKREAARSGLLQEDGSGLSAAQEKKASADCGIDKRELEVIDAIRRNHTAAVKEGYKAFILELPADEEGAVLYLLRLAVRVQLYVRETYGGGEKLSGAFEDFYRMLFTVSGTAAVDILYKLVLRTVAERMEYCRENSADYFSSYIRQAKDYIEIHYMEETLTINDVAAAVYLTPVYFGRVFKQGMGISFRRYLMNVRMEKAKFLLAQRRYGVLQVGGMVGIGNPSYFTQMFKQYAGQLPSEYASPGEQEGECS